MMDTDFMPFNLYSILKLVQTYPIVWVSQQATEPYLDGILQLLLVIMMSLLVWVLLNRILFPATTALTNKHKEGRRNI